MGEQLTDGALAVPPPVDFQQAEYRFVSSQREDEGGIGNQEIIAGGIQPDLGLGFPAYRSGSVAAHIVKIGLKPLDFKAVSISILIQPNLKIHNSQPMKIIATEKRIVLFRVTDLLRVMSEIFHQKADPGRFQIGHIGQPAHPGNHGKRQLTNKVYADGKGPTYIYGIGGRLKTRTWARTDSGGNPLTTTYLYDTNTVELVSINYNDTTPDISFTYGAIRGDANRHRCRRPSVV